MKKGVLALLIAVALVVIVSPGIIGRLAEKTMDEQLERAVAVSDEVVVRSEGFVRGWFSSAGRHRVELRDGRLRDVLVAFSDAEASGKLPALIIDTRIDHGLVPLSSIAREQGTLVPGLGSAVSTLSLDTGAGEPMPLPGTLFSTLGLAGDLRVNYVLEAGTFTHDGATAGRRGKNIDVTASNDVDAEFHLALGKARAAEPSWPGVLLAADASLDFRIAERLVRLAMAANPEVGAIVGMGYLRRNGDIYELRAELEDGLLTVNGAPLPLPFNALQ